MLRGMEGSVLGTWVAHGEGRAYFPDANMYAICALSVRWLLGARLLTCV